MAKSKKKSVQPGLKSSEKSDFDSGWKDAFLLALQQLLQLLFEDIHDDIDWSKPFRFHDKELREVLRDLKQGKRNADLLVEVYLKSGDSLIIYLHIEVQAEWEADFPERIYAYNGRFVALLKRPVASLVVYADENPNWAPDTYVLKCPTGTTETRFTFDTAKILDFKNQRERLEKLVEAKNVAALGVLAQLDAIEAGGDSPKKLEMRKGLIRRMFEAGLARDQIYALFRILDHILFLKPPEKLTFKDWLSDYLEEKPMPLVSTFDIICDEREEKGRANFAIAICERYVGNLPKKTKELVRKLDEEALLDLQAVATQAKSAKEITSWVKKRTGK